MALVRMTADISALRRMAKDGPLSVDGDSQLLLTASLTAAVVVNDDAGSSRMVKRVNNTGRDDAAATLMLAAGAWERDARRPKQRWRSAGVA